MTAGSFEGKMAEGPLELVSGTDEVEMERLLVGLSGRSFASGSEF